MTSKRVVLRVLDCAFIALTLTLLLAIVGLRLDLFDLVAMPLREFEGFTLFMLFGLLSLIHAIASSDSAP